VETSDSKLVSPVSRHAIYNRCQQLHFHCRCYCIALFARKTKCCEEDLLIWQLLCDHLERLLDIHLKLATFRTATSAKNDPLSDETSRSPYSLHMYGSPFCLTQTPALASVPARVPARVPAPMPSFGSSSYASPCTTATKAGSAPHHADTRDKAELDW
jgi:hypothetical protein